MRERFYVGTVVIVETGVMCGMQLFVASNASAVKKGGNGTTVCCRRQQRGKTKKEKPGTISTYFSKRENKKRKEMCFEEKQGQRHEQM